MRSKTFILGLSMLLVLVLVVGTGCRGKKDAPLETGMDSGMTGTKAPELTTGEGLPDVEQERLLWSKATGLQPVYFAFDSSALSPEARGILKGNSEKIRQVAGVMIQIEGHCDERGTQEYNLALGERRALATRAYLVDLGVSGDRMLTISYGEEKPAVEGNTEAAYQMNRRCEFNKAM
jgi:peptidoglycan-associated lipoprotein